MQKLENVVIMSLEEYNKIVGEQSVKKELEVGKWLIHPNSSLFHITSKDDKGVLFGYGFNNRQQWSDNTVQGAINCAFNDVAKLKTREATPQEVEDALTKEAKKRGFEYDSYIFDERTNILWGNNNDDGKKEKAVFNNGKWIENIEVDKFAELKEAHKNGAVIQLKDLVDDVWDDLRTPAWNPKREYRIKPEEETKEKSQNNFKNKLDRFKEKYEHETNMLVDLCHGLSKEAGWHDKPREVGTMLALIHSEVSEALEGFRKDLNDDHLTNRRMAEVELADAVIRIFDLAGSQGFNLGGALVEKLVYNTKREDHKLENRNNTNGKKF